MISYGYPAVTVRCTWNKSRVNIKHAMTFCYTVAPAGTDSMPKLQLARMNPRKRTLELPMALMNDWTPYPYTPGLKKKA